MKTRICSFTYISIYLYICVYMFINILFNIIHRHINNYIKNSNLFGQAAPSFISLGLFMPSEAFNYPIALCGPLYG